MKERVKFILEWERRWNEGEGVVNMTALCREFGVSRQCGYKWVNRYVDADRDLRALDERSRRPHHCPRALDQHMEDLLVRARKKRPYYGPSKLRQWLLTWYDDEELPAPSTIGAVLKKRGLTRPRKKRQRTPPCSQPFQSCDRPNAVWSVDFKGHFSTGDGTRCYPLTIMDAHSRFLLCCEALTDTSVRNAMPVFESVFAEFGLPEAIRSDNGSPFASKGAGGLTELSAWWTRLGIRHERIEPGHPEQNGRHERMHWTLKEQTALPPGASLKAQQRAFDLFRRQYNEERPHQALSNATPSSVYERSPRQLPARLPRFEYPFADGVELVDKQGQIEWGRRKIHINVALYGELVGVWIIDAGRWEVSFGPVLLGYIDRSRPSKKLIVPKPGWNTLAQTP